MLARCLALTSSGGACACISRSLARSRARARAQGEFCCVRDNGKGMTEEQLHLGLLGRGRAPPPPGGGSPPSASSPATEGDIIRFFGTGYAVWMAHLATEGVGATVVKKTNTGTLFRNVRARTPFLHTRVRACLLGAHLRYQRAADASRASSVTPPQGGTATERGHV